ncbi:MAG: VWA domain-containing protein [Candidatus Limnocylindrales bacterium]
MTLLAPERLALIVVPILLVAGYLLLQRRRTKYALRFSATELLDTVAPDRPGWRRHLPAVAYLAAVLLLVVGAARPALAMDVAEKPTIMLALDVSNSMNATDVSPTRLIAAKDAAERFLDIVPAGTRIGLVAFSGSARVVTAPTADHDLVRSAISQLQLGPGTAIGEAIYASLAELPKVAPGSPAAATPSPAAGSSAGDPSSPGGGTTSAAGSIVLMSDGMTTVGRPDSEAANAAKAAGVPVSTIAFGTPNGTVTIQGQTIPVPVDSNALKAIADTTGGKFFTAASAEQLQAAYAAIGSAVGTSHEDREITDWMVGGALAAAVVAGVGSLVWFSRLP